MNINLPLSGLHCIMAGRGGGEGGGGAESIESEREGRKQPKIKSDPLLLFANHIAQEI